MFPGMMRLLAAALTLAALAGCTTFGGTNKFACPHPQGVTCMSATDVYEATNDADEIIGVDPDEARKDASEGKPAGRPHVAGDTLALDDAPAFRTSRRPIVSTGATPAPRPAPTAVAIDGDTLSLAAAPPAAGLGGTGVQDVNEPYRVPAKILRIYVRPWQDADGDLHLGSYIYSEVQARTWSVARSVEPPTPRTFQLLAPVPASAGGKGAGGSASPDSPSGAPPGNAGPPSGPPPPPSTTRS